MVRLDLVLSSLGAMSSPMCAACLGCPYLFARLSRDMGALRSSIILPVVHLGPCGPTPRYLRPSCGRRNPPMIAQRATAGTGSRVRVSYRSKFRPAAHQSVALGGDEIGPVRTGKIHAPPPLLGFSAPNSRVQPADQPASPRDRAADPSPPDCFVTIAAGAPFDGINALPGDHLEISEALVRGRSQSPACNGEQFRQHRNPLQSCSRSAAAAPARLNSVSWNLSECDLHHADTLFLPTLPRAKKGITPPMSSGWQGALAPAYRERSRDPPPSW
jgi:hypothetical protein